MDVDEELVLVLFDLEERETPEPFMSEIKRKGQNKVNTSTRSA